MLSYIPVSHGIDNFARSLITYEVAQASRLVPSNAVGINVHLAQATEHLGLVVGVGLRARGGTGAGGAVVLLVLVVVVLLDRGLSRGERERVGDLELAIDIHACKHPP